ncbi:isochorismatase family protein [bacterium]|nr:isochorismatase family protein [bacterium]
MTILNENDSLLFVIDVQDKLLNAAFNKEVLKNKAEIMVKAANILNIPIIVTEQYPKGLGETIPEIKNVYSEKFFPYEKSSFSALDEESIFDALKNYDRHQIVVLGIETHICINQTVNTLIELGYDVSIICDACGSRSSFEHNAGVDRMREDGAHILTTEIALFEWLKTSKHPHFKEIQALIK